MQLGSIQSGATLINASVHRSAASDSTGAVLQQSTALSTQSSGTSSRTTSGMLSEHFVQLEADQSRYVQATLDGFANSRSVQNQYTALLASAQAQAATAGDSYAERTLAAKRTEKMVALNKSDQLSEELTRAAEKQAESAAAAEEQTAESDVTQDSAEASATATTTAPTTTTQTTPAATTQPETTLAATTELATASASTSTPLAHPSLDLVV